MKLGYNAVGATSWLTAVSVLLATVAVTVLQTSASASAGKRCKPPTDLASARVVRAPNEVTEYFGEGAYRVTRCRADGSLHKSVTVESIETFAGERVKAPVAVVQEVGAFYRQVNLDYAAVQNPSAAREQRERLGASVPPPTQPVPASLEAGSSKSTAYADTTMSSEASGSSTGAVFEGNECRTEVYSGGTGLLWPGNGEARGSYGYYVNINTTRAAGIADGAIERGHKNWDNTVSNCVPDDQTNFVTYLLGSTDLTMSYQAPDGVNVVDYGPIPGTTDPSVLAVTVSWWRNGSPYFIDADIRFSNLAGWYAPEPNEKEQRRSGYYDVESVATHEVGHTLSLGHVLGPRQYYQTMYVSVPCQSCISPRTLGRGDVAGMRWKYPPL